MVHAGNPTDSGDGTAEMQADVAGPGYGCSAYSFALSSSPSHVRTISLPQIVFYRAVLNSDHAAAVRSEHNSGLVNMSPFKPVAVIWMGDRGRLWHPDFNLPDGWAKLPRTNRV